MAFEKDYSKHDYNSSDFYPGGFWHDFNTGTFKYYDFDGTSKVLAQSAFAQSNVPEVGDNLHAFAYFGTDESVKAVLFDKKTLQFSEIDLTDYIEWAGYILPGEYNQNLILDIKKLSGDTFVLNASASAAHFSSGGSTTELQRSNVVFKVDQGNQDDPSTFSVESAYSEIVPEGTVYPYHSHSLSSSGDSYQIVYTDAEFNEHYPFSPYSNLNYFPEPIPLNDDKIVFICERIIGPGYDQYSKVHEYYYRVFDVTNNEFDNELTT